MAAGFLLFSNKAASPTGVPQIDYRTGDAPTVRLYAASFLLIQNASIIILARMDIVLFGIPTFALRSYGGQARLLFFSSF
jgi:hypothetical protein